MTSKVGVVVTQLLALTVLLAACASAGAQRRPSTLLPIVPRADGVASVATAWAWQSPRPQGNTLNALVFADERVGWAVGESGTFLATTDGGVAWHGRRAGTDHHLTGIAAVSATVVWAVGRGGVVRRSDDGGTTFVARDTAGLDPVSALGPFRIAAPSATVAWVVGAERALKTSDGGATWQEQLARRGTLTDVAAPAPSVAWVAGNDGLVLRTEDGGATWSDRSVLPGFASVETAIAAQSADVAWVVGGEDHGSRGVYHTVDGGRTWSNRTPPGLSARAAAVAAASATAAWVVGVTGALWATTDGGATWTEQRSTTQPRLIALAAPSARAVRGVGQYGAIATSDDGGATWTERASAPVGLHILADVAVVAPSTVWAVGHGIAHSDDGGLTWTRQRQADLESLTAIAPASNEVAYAAGWRINAEDGSTEGVVLGTADGGRTWSSRASGTRGYLTAVTAASSSAAWAAGADGTILATTDGGQTWRAQPSGTADYLGGIAAASPLVAWAVGDGGTILATTDGGATWRRQASGTTAALRGVVALSTSAAWAVGADATILRTAHGGATWLAQTAPTRPATFLAIAAASPRVAWAVGDGGTGPGLIVATTDGGVTWSVQGPADAGRRRDGRRPPCLGGQSARRARRGRTRVSRRTRAGQHHGLGDRPRPMPFRRRNRSPHLSGAPAPVSGLHPAPARRRAEAIPAMRLESRNCAIGEMGGLGVPWPRIADAIGMSPAGMVRLPRPAPSQLWAASRGQVGRRPRVTPSDRTMLSGRAHVMSSAGASASGASG